MARQRRIGSSAVQTPRSDKSRQEIVNLLTDSEIKRRIEIEFSGEALNFSSSTRYPATIRCIDQAEFNVVVPPDGEFEAPPEDNALQGIQLTLSSLDRSFADSMEQVTSYFYEQEIGHILGFSNQVMQLRTREILRVPFEDKIILLVIHEGHRTQQREEIETYALNLSGAGVAVRGRKGLGLTAGRLLELRFTNPTFPGYDASQEFAALTGQIIRVFPNDDQPAWENLGIQFMFDDAFAEFQGRDQISTFCIRISFTEHQQKVEAELAAKYGSAFKKKRRRF